MSRAAAALGLAQPTLSGQIRKLEEALDEKLFVRTGRRLALTETGTLVYGYAEEIFALGRELQQTLAGGASAGEGRQTRFRRRSDPSARGVIRRLRARPQGAVRAATMPRWRSRGSAR